MMKKRLSFVVAGFALAASAGEWYEDELTAGFSRVPDEDVLYEATDKKSDRIKICTDSAWYIHNTFFDLANPTQYFGKTIAIAFKGRGTGQISLEYEWTKRAPTIHSVVSPTFADCDMPYRVIFGPVPSNKVVRVHIKTTARADITYPVFLVSDTAPAPHSQTTLPDGTWTTGHWPGGYAEGRRLPLADGEADLAPLADFWSFNGMTARQGYATDGSMGSLTKDAFVLSFPQPVTATGFRWTLPPAVADIWADTTGDGQYDTLLYRNWNGYAFSTWKNLQEYVWLTNRFAQAVQVRKVLVTAGAHEFELTGPAAQTSQVAVAVHAARPTSAPYQPAARALAVGEALAVQPEAPSVDDQYWYGFCLEPWMFGMEGVMERYYNKGIVPPEVETWPEWQTIAADYHALNANFILLFPPQSWRMPPGVTPRGTYPYPLLWPSDVWYCNQTNDMLASFNRACHKEGFKNFVIPREWLFKTNETAEAKQVTFAREISSRDSDGVPVCVDEHYMSVRAPMTTDAQKAAFLEWSGLTEVPTERRNDKAMRLLYLYGAKYISDWMADIKTAQLETNPNAVTFGGFAGCDYWQERVTGYVSGCDFWGWEGKCDVIGGDGTYFGVGEESNGPKLASMIPYVETAVQVSCTPKRRSMATVNCNWGIRWDNEKQTLNNPLVYDDYPAMAQKAGALASFFAKGEFMDFWRYNFMDDWNGPAYRQGVREGGYMAKVLGAWGGKKAEVPKDVLVLRSRTSEDWWSLRYDWPLKADAAMPSDRYKNWGHRLFFWTAARLVERATPFEIYQLQRVAAWRDIAANYKLIVIPFAYSISDEEAAALKAAADAGVKILVLGGDEAGTVDAIGEDRATNGLAGIDIERFEIANPDVPASKQLASDFDAKMKVLLPAPSLAIDRDENHDVQAYMLSVGPGEKLMMVANWSERATSVNLHLALPDDSYVLEVCDGETVRAGTIGGKETFGAEDAASFRVDLAREDVQLYRVRSAGHAAEPAIYVAPGGHDDTGAGTAASPYATIAHALSVAAAGDEIRVAGGLYTEAVVVSTVSNTISGSWLADFSAQDFKNHRTVIKAPSASSDCVTANNSSLKLVGLDLTGGRYGFYGNYGSTRQDRTPPPPWNTLWACVASNNQYGVYSTRLDGLVLASCLLAHNTTEGVFVNNDTGGYNYYYNCTFADNGEAGIRRNHNYDADMYAYNSLVLDNAAGVYWNTTTPAKAITFYHALFHGNGQDALTGAYTDSIFPKIYYNTFLLKDDPKVDAAYAPQAGSPAIGVGYDLSAETKTCPHDLYGTAWDGRYDLGCVKSASETPSKAATLYVATTGDDANDGLTAATAKRTINAAAGLVADGGTINVAKGTYTEGVALSVPNVTLAGEDRETTIIEAMATTAGATAYVSTRPDYAVAIVATNVTVKNFTLRNAHAGAYLSVSKEHTSNDAKLVNCRMTANLNGVAATSPNTRNSDCTLSLSRCIVNANGNRGMYVFGTLRVVNTLIADNANYGIYSDGWDQDAASHYANVTFADNGSYGYYNNGNDSIWGKFDNCIFSGHATAGVHARSTFTIRSSCFHANGAATEAQTSRATSPTLTDCFYGDPDLDETSSQRGHLGKDSSCVQTGAVYADSPFALTDDLDGNPRLEDKIDVGCFVSDKTLEDLVGHGYHLLTVAGDPDGYGIPTPGYGKHLTQDGPLTFDLAPILTSDAFDGKRVTVIDDGIRAIYKGYAYRLDDAAEPLYESETAESLTVPDFSANATFTIRWQKQVRVIASTSSDGCSVSVGGCAAGLCVTNWVDDGEEYAIAFTPSVNFAFKAWSGDFPESGDARLASTTAVADRPRTIAATTRPLVHVCKTGDDTNGDGTRAKPFASIARAIAAAEAESVIYVQKGVYNESVVNASVNNLSFRGGYDENWNRDLRNAQSVVEPPSASDDGFRLYRVYNNEVSGFVVRGANCGVYTVGPSSAPSEGTRVTRQNLLTQLVVTNNVCGIQTADGHCGSRIVSCLVGYNTNDGISWYCDNKGEGYVHNCTIVRNGKAGIRSGYGYCWMDYRNNVVAFNGTHNVAFVSSYLFGAGCEFTAKVFIGLCVAEAGQGNFETVYNGVRIPESELSVMRGLMAGIYFLDPILGDDFSPQAGSPCLATGMNLHDYPLAAELEDLYGEAWNGVYNLGCVKGAAATPEKVSDVYVAPTGDDANDGLTAATPMKSVQKALLKLAENGTCHLAAGTYDEPIGCYVGGMTLAGAGVGKTVVRGVPTAEGAEEPFNILVAADDVTVRDLTSTAGQSGLKLSCSRFGVNTVVRDCAFAGNTNGVLAQTIGIRSHTILPLCREAWPDLDCTDAPNHRLSRCSVTDNVLNGFYASRCCRSSYSGAYNVLGDNLLVARNGENGVKIIANSSADDYPDLVSRFVYSTFADNGAIGVGNGSENDGAVIAVANSVVTGNAIGVKRAAYTGMTVDNSAVAGNDVNTEAAPGTGALPVFTDCVDEGLLFNPSHPYRPAAGSSAIGLPRDLTAEDRIAEPTVDLDGNTRKPKAERRVAGCYAERAHGLLLLVR